MTWRRGRRSGEAGQATVELLAALPAVALVVVLGWQLLVAGHAWWSVSEASRIAARTLFVRSQEEGRASGLRSARRIASVALPASLRREAHLVRRGSSTVRLTVRVPLVAPLAALGLRGPWISAGAGFGV